MSILTALARLKDSVATTMRQLHDNHATARTAIEEKRLELERTRAALPPRAELVERFAMAVDAAGEAWRQEHGRNFIVARVGRDARFPFALNECPTWGMLAAWMPLPIKRGFSELVSSVAYVEGPAIAERARVLARLEQELASLEAAEEALVDEAVAAGVPVSHRPEVQQRRENERRAQEARAQIAEDRAARQRELDQWHATQRRRAGISQYLQPKSEA